MLDSARSPGLVRSPAATDAGATGLGRAFVDAILVGDFDRLQALLAPDVRFRAITPGSHVEASTAAGARARVEGWFGGTDARLLLASTVELVVDWLALGYRLALTEDGERHIVEQHVVAVVDGSSFRDLSVLCSGFRPVARDVPAAWLDATGLSCATLTPTIAAAVRGLDIGAVLEIVTDDPDAEEGLRSWTRLTGNALVNAGAGPGPSRRFAIRRSPRDAAASTGKEAS